MDTLAALIFLTRTISEKFFWSYSEALQVKADRVSAFVTEEKTLTEELTIPFLWDQGGIQKVPIQEQLMGSKMLGGSYYYKLEKWGDILSIRETQLRDPLFSNRILTEAANLGKKMAAQPWREIVNILLNGDTDASLSTFDNVLAFSASHKIGPQNATYSNFHTGLPITGSNIWNIIANYIMKIPMGANGEYMPMDDVKIYVLAAPIQKETLDPIAFNTKRPDQNYSTENFFKGSFIPMYDEFLSDDPNSYYIIAVPSNMKPFTMATQSTNTTDKVVPRFSPSDVIALKTDTYEWEIKKFAKLRMMWFPLVHKISNS